MKGHQGPGGVTPHPPKPTFRKLEKRVSVYLLAQQLWVAGRAADLSQVTGKNTHSEKKDTILFHPGMIQLFFGFPIKSLGI